MQVLNDQRYHQIHRRKEQASQKIEAFERPTEKKRTRI